MFKKYIFNKNQLNILGKVIYPWVTCKKLQKKAISGGGDSEYLVKREHYKNKGQKPNVNIRSFKQFA